jgi:hypothetical protein
MKVPPGFVLKRTYGAICDALVNSARDAIVNYKKTAFAAISETCANLADCFAPWPLLHSSEALLTQPSLGDSGGVAYKRAHGWVATCRIMSLHTTLLTLGIGNLIDRPYAAPRGLASPSTGRSIFIVLWMSSTEAALMLGGLCHQ